MNASCLQNNREYFTLHSILNLSNSLTFFKHEKVHLGIHSATTPPRESKGKFTLTRNENKVT